MLFQKKEIMCYKFSKLVLNNDKHGARKKWLGALYLLGFEEGIQQDPSQKIIVETWTK